MVRGARQDLDLGARPSASRPARQRQGPAMIERFLTRPKRRRRGRTCPRAVLALSLLGLSLIGLAALAGPGPGVVWNASASAPVRLHPVLPGNAVRGSLVPARTPHLGRPNDA